MRPNNFDLIRLFAALQVMVLHSLYYLHVPTNGLEQALPILPGVPIFFFVSGYLVSASWERSAGIRDFAGKRARRIFPALWAVLILELVLVLGLYRHGTTTDILAWLAAHATIGQDWNPRFLLGFGTGAINGSEWTIPIELSFYVAVPIIYLLSPRGKDWLLLAVAAASFSTLHLMPQIARWGHPIITEFRLFVSPAPWIGMFCIGALAQRHSGPLVALLSGRLVPAFITYFAVLGLGWALHAPVWLLGWQVDIAGVLTYLGLAAVILSAAYTAPRLSDRLLKGNDLSYGLYLVHMPLVNTCLWAGLTGWAAILVVWPMAITLAALSWVFIERPNLARRRQHSVPKLAIS